MLVAVALAVTAEKRDVLRDEAGQALVHICFGLHSRPCELRVRKYPFYHGSRYISPVTDPHPAGPFFRTCAGSFLVRCPLAAPGV